jgi:REP element-mobilizing transposase RayT
LAWQIKLQAPLKKGAYSMQRKPKTTAFWTRNLPHWEVEDGRYFITIHLRGAIPVAGRRHLATLVKQLRSVPDRDSPQWVIQQRAIFREMEAWLDRSQWEPKLQQADVAAMVVEAIEHRQQRGTWHLLQYVVMPTHLHLFCEVGNQELKGILEDFKRWTGHQAAKILSQHATRFWQSEWFDHWSRSDQQDEQIARYIQKNPEKAGLVQDYQQWPYGFWSKRK